MIQTWTIGHHVYGLLQAFTAASLLLLEQVGGQPHQEVWVCGPGQVRHEAAEERDPGENPAEEDKGPVCRRACPPTEVRHCPLCLPDRSHIVLKVILQDVLWSVKHESLFKTLN